MMVYSLIAEEERKKNGYSKSACFRMIGVSSSGYYSWLKRYEDKDGKRAQKKKELQDIQEKFRQIIRKLGFVPIGQRRMPIKGRQRTIMSAALSIIW